VLCGDNYTLMLNDSLHAKNSISILFFLRKIKSIASVNHHIIDWDKENFRKKRIHMNRHAVQSLKNENIIDISVGCRHSACIDEKGEIFCSEINLYDQLGLGDSERDYSKPTKVTRLDGHFVRIVSCGYFHIEAILDN